jgi:chemotaxis protein histidine kinase CheA
MYELPPSALRLAVHVNADEHEPEAGEQGVWLSQLSMTSQPRCALTSKHKLDELVNLIGELVLERSRLLQLSKEISTGHSDCYRADSPLSHSVARLSFITEEL